MRMQVLTVHYPPHPLHRVILHHITHELLEKYDANDLTLIILRKLNSGGAIIFKQAPPFAWGQTSVTIRVWKVVIELAEYIQMLYTQIRWSLNNKI